MWKRLDEPGRGGVLVAGRVIW